MRGLRDKLKKPGHVILYISLSSSAHAPLWKSPTRDLWPLKKKRKRKKNELNWGQRVNFLWFICLGGQSWKSRWKKEEQERRATSWNCQSWSQVKARSLTCDVKIKINFFCVMTCLFFSAPPTVPPPLAK